MRNRGASPRDKLLFHDRRRSVLKSAVNDLSWLLTHGYAVHAASELVGNRHRLTKRQRESVIRMSVGAPQVRQRKKIRVSSSVLRNATIEIDGFNQLILVEGLLSGAYIFRGKDGVYRDISGIHGSYRRVSQTQDAILMVGRSLQHFGASRIHWILDKPVSNSGRLRSLLTEIARNNGFPWTVQLVNNPDAKLVRSDYIVITSDGHVLDQVKQWYNLIDYLVKYKIRNTNIISA